MQAKSKWIVCVLATNRHYRTTSITRNGMDLDLLGGGIMLYLWNDILFSTAGLLVSRDIESDLDHLYKSFLGEFYTHF